ncbi:MAG: hypothetical protein ACYS9T_11145 [Planctomycetota bacterium]|jgi:hypothetical protein
MPLHVRPIAVGIAVIFFFGISLVGWISGLSPYTCCKRALAGAVLAYLAGTIAVRAINAVLMHAMITNQMNQKRTKASGSKD